MSHPPPTTTGSVTLPRRLAGGTVVAALLLATALPAFADRVQRRHGPDVEGHVVSVDAESVVVRTERGRVRLDRSEVASIAFAEAPPPSTPLKVEIRNVRSNEAIEVSLHDELIIRRAAAGGSWIDITDRLNTGNNPLRLRIYNSRGSWAYELNVRINGEITRLACGEPRRPDRPCTCCGKSGRETGVIDDLPVVWLHVDRERGLAEVLP